MISRTLTETQRRRYQALLVVWPEASTWQHHDDPGPAGEVYALLDRRHQTHDDAADLWIGARALYVALSTGRSYDRDTSTPEECSFLTRFFPVELLEEPAADQYVEALGLLDACSAALIERGLLEQVEPLLGGAYRTARRGAGLTR